MKKIIKDHTYKCSKCGMREIGKDVGILIVDSEKQLLCADCFINIKTL